MVKTNKMPNAIKLIKGIINLFDTLKRHNRTLD